MYTYIMRINTFLNQKLLFAYTILEPVKLLAEHDLEFLSLTGRCTGSYMSLHLSNCHIVGNHMSPIIWFVMF